jgi:hypothetical protein
MKYWLPTLLLIALAAGPALAGSDLDPAVAAAEAQRVAAMEKACRSAIVIFAHQGNSTP